MVDMCQIFIVVISDLVEIYFHLQLLKIIYNFCNIILDLHIVLYKLVDLVLIIHNINILNIIDHFVLHSLYLLYFYLLVLDHILVQIYTC